MKAVIKIFWIVAVISLLAGCGSKNEESMPAATPEPAEKDMAETKENTSKDEGEEADMTNGNEVHSEENEAVEPDSATADTVNQQNEDALSKYSSEQIEYARVWLQLGPNQDIDGLYVKRIPAGTPLNPDDETSGTYPEPVIQLAGSRLVDGSVTYSGNGDGDGTINVYNVPLRWDGEYPAGEEFYTEFINNTELVSVDVGEDAEVARLIELLIEQP